MHQDRRSQALTEGLLEAIKAELDGYHFYKMAARSTDDDKGREVFELLAEEELDHKRFLQAQYQAILSTGKPDSAVKLGRRADLSGDSPIFSDGLRQRAGEAHYEMTALSIGVQLEAASMKHYRAAADEADDPAVKAFFDELARWEQGHYEALLRQQGQLKDAYWSASGFAPF